MLNKTKSVLWISFSCLIILCIAVFTWITFTMNEKSQDSISDIGMIYMSEVNRQLQQKFDVIINLRLSQLEEITEGTNYDIISYDRRMLDDLASRAAIRNFDYLGLYAEDGSYEVVYGDSLLIDTKDFLRKLEDGNIKVGSGSDKNGNRMLVLGIRAAYPMQNRARSTALIAAIPMEWLKDALVLDEEDALLYTHIIDKQGKFVIRSGDAYRDSYFDRMKQTWQEENGKKPEQYVEEFQMAISDNKDYSVSSRTHNGYQHVYCSHLINSDWYLVSVMPYGRLDDAIHSLGNERLSTVMKAVIIIVTAIILIFILYYWMSQQQLKRLDEARQEAVHANKAKSEFLSNMSHDIRTPMNGIVGMTAIAIANINDTEHVQNCLKKISLSSKHLLGLINDVLDMSKIESGKMTLNMDQISLCETMNSIVNIIQPQVKARNQHFDIFIQNIETEEVYCDSVRLNQVLINLLSNAIKFTPEGGRINIYLAQEASPMGANYIRCHFRVKDNGIGMTPEFQKVIFDTFTREDTSQVQKTEGTGLGMAITKRIVETMKGTIELKSAPGEGSEFHITIDLEKATTSLQDMMLPPWNMLVVDNNEDLCRSAVSVLKEIGVHAEWALDGKTAVKMIEKCHNQKRDYQLVLLDWKMPDMDGLQTTREIRKHLGNEVPILIISAYDWSDIEEEARKAGVQGFISKPLFKSNLYLGLKHYMLEEPEEEPQKVEDFTGKHILLAEDNDLNWEIANELLSAAGFELERAENGKVCVEKFQQSKEGTYDVILMDIRMPVMSGYDAAKNIRALHRKDADLPIIAMTADAFSEDIQHSLECGMNAHIAKPIDVSILIQQLKKYLKE